MNADVVVAWLHYVTFMVLFAALVAQHLLIKKPVTPAEAKRVSVLDAICGIAFIGVVITGTLKLLRFGKGLEFYMQAWQFHAKITLVVLAFLISLYPTIVFQNYRKRTKDLPADERVEYPPGLKHAIRLEMVFMVLVPLFAASLARAVGQFD